MTSGDPRRRRVARLHHLHPDHRASDIESATADVVVLHATDPASVFLGLLARTVAPTIDDIERALYDDRSLVRVLAMRRTLFVAPAEDAPFVQAACSFRVAEEQRRTFSRQLGRFTDIADPDAFIAEAMAVAEGAIAEAGTAVARTLTTEHPILQTRWDAAPGKKWGKSSPVTSRILSQLDMEGRIERARPTGKDFTSTAFQWRVTDPEALAEARAMDPEAARARLFESWLRRFGPATEDDLVWWSGLTKTLVRSAVARLDTVPADVDGRPGLRMADDEIPSDGGTDPGPWVALLPGLDPTSMGWRHREWYVGAHTAELFDRNGNVGPTVWADGRIVGVWAQRVNGEISLSLLEPLDPAHRALLGDEIDRVQVFLGDVRVTPRFRTPLERELSA